MQGNHLTLEHHAVLPVQELHRLSQVQMAPNLDDPARIGQHPVDDGVQHQVPGHADLVLGRHGAGLPPRPIAAPHLMQGPQGGGVGLADQPGQRFGAVVAKCGEHLSRRAQRQRPMQPGERLDDLARRAESSYAPQ
jgi:hypothetical protein